MDFQAFVILLLVKSRAPWMRMSCCGEGDGEVLQGTVGSRQPHSALGSPWSRPGLCRKWMPTVHMTSAREGTEKRELERPGPVLLKHMYREHH